MAKEINALGGDITELPDGLRITPRPLRAGSPPAKLVRQLRRSPAGDGRGRAGPRGSRDRRRERANRRQDLPRLHRGLGDDAGPGLLTPQRSRPGYDRLDEDDIRVRPGRSSRPRTRRRPAHESALRGLVTSVDRGRYGCVTDGRLIVAMKARELGRGSVVVGDLVALAGDTSGAEGTLARIVRVEPRSSALRRSPDDTDPLERIIVANADQLLIVCKLAEPPPRLRFVDRCLVAAYDAGLEPLLLLTKADLAPVTARRKIRTFCCAARPACSQHKETAACQHARPAAQHLGRSGQRAHRPVGRRQVNAGQRPRPSCGAGNRKRQPGHRPRPAHVLFRRRASAGGRRPAQRFAAGRRARGYASTRRGCARVRLGACQRGTGGRGVRGPGRRHPRTCPPGCDHLSAGCAPRRMGGATSRADKAQDSLRRLLTSHDPTTPD